MFGVRSPGYLRKDSFPATPPMEGYGEASLKFFGMLALKNEVDQKDNNIKEYEESSEGSEQGRTVDALAPRGEEGRDKLRKSLGRRK